MLILRRYPEWPGTKSAALLNGARLGSSIRAAAVRSISCASPPNALGPFERHTGAQAWLQRTQFSVVTHDAQPP